MLILEPGSKYAVASTICRACVGAELCTFVKTSKLRRCPLTSALFGSG